MKRSILLTTLLTATLTMASDYKYEISPMIGYDFTEANLNIKDDSYPVFGLEAQFNSTDSSWSPEFSLLYSQGVDYVNGGSTKVIRGAFNAVHTYDAYESFIPFAKVGAGYEKISSENIDNKSGFFLDAGAGTKVPFTDNVALKLEAIYLPKLFTDNSGRVDNNFIFMAGLTFSFGEHAQKAAPKTQESAPVVQESTPEPAKESASAAVVAAPVVIDGDDDKDGVKNSKDKCPNSLEGIVVDMNGCDADKDKDGVLNEKDICPNTPLGEAVNDDGCPKTVNLHIKFENNSAAIKGESMPLMQQYADFLNAHTNYKAHIVGYTDSKGSETYNQKLSEKRANAVVLELENRGVAKGQLSASGKGEANPIADNKTADGRAQNRRIEAQLTRE
ncbi:MAG: OmpA family protein [Campylobacterales bacterium]|nr:OmpA family protein [Campylobacterales bacterium]